MKFARPMFRMATQLPNLPDVQQLSTNVIRILGGNPSKFTLQGSNTYLLGRGPLRMLLDTGQGIPSWPIELSSTLKDQSATVSTCLLSHWHHDHVGGVKDLLSLHPNVKLFKNTPSLNPDGILDISQVSDIADGQTFAVGHGEERFEVKALHTPGHAKDHMCFIVTSSSDDSEMGSLFTADNVLGHGTAVFEDLAVYLSSLALMKRSIGQGRRAYPGHGEVMEDGRERMEYYIQHRRSREEEALNVLKHGRTSRPGVAEPGKEVIAKEWGSMEMVKVIYAHVPENLHEPAENGLLMVLEKLHGDGKVIREEGGTWRIGEKAIL